MENRLDVWSLEIKWEKYYCGSLELGQNLTKGEEQRTGKNDIKTVLGVKDCVHPERLRIFAH